MFEELLIFKKEFERIKKMGYVKTSRSGTMAIQNTFMNLGRNKVFFDFDNIKIKIKSDLTRNYAILFKATPKGSSEEEVKRLRNTYGECDPVLKKTKTLFADVQANCCTLVGSRYLFRLEIDYEEEKIYLVVTDQNKTIHERKAYWSFQTLKKKMDIYLQNIILVKAWTKRVGTTDYYKFYDYDFYQLKDFDTFLKLLEEGTIRVSFRVGIYRNGAKTGKMKDNGTIFEIQELDLDKLYQRVKP